MRGKRDKAMVDRVLGDKARAVLVSDFYAAYNHYPGLKQRCWAHLLRDIGELVETHPKDEVLKQWAEAVQKVYQEAKAFQSDDEQERIRSQLEYDIEPARGVSALHGQSTGGAGGIVPAH